MEYFCKMELSLIQNQLMSLTVRKRMDLFVLKGQKDKNEINMEMVSNQATKEEKTTKRSVTIAARRTIPNKIPVTRVHTEILKSCGIESDVSKGICLYLETPQIHIGFHTIKDDASSQRHSHECFVGISEVKPFAENVFGRTPPEDFMAELRLVITSIEKTGERNDPDCRLRPEKSNRKFTVFLLQMSNRFFLFRIVNYTNFNAVSFADVFQFTHQGRRYDSSFNLNLIGTTSQTALFAYHWIQDGIPKETRWAVKMSLSLLIYPVFMRVPPCCETSSLTVNPYDDPLHCVKCLETGFQYNIRELKFVMEERLLLMATTWFTAEASLRLCLFLKEISTLTELKTKSEMLLKS